MQRTVSYWITVQKYRDGKPYQDPFRLRDDINFEKDYQLRLNITSPQSGRLYLLNEGPPGADQNSDVQRDVSHHDCQQRLGSADAKSADSNS